jgi:dienelactone hydrolase
VTTAAGSFWLKWLRALASGIGYRARKASVTWFSTRWRSQPQQNPGCPMNPLRAFVVRLPAVAILNCILAVAAYAAAPASLFDYDHNAPLNVREVGTETRDGVLQRDLTFDVAGRSLKAYLVAPVIGNGSCAGILYVHWLGEPASTNRTEFLDEARTLAHEGVVSLLVDTMWAEPHWYKNRMPEEDYAHALRQVVELRRAMDLLLTQPGVDSRRIAYVGHDFGAMYGTVMGAVDQRAKTYVLMAGVPHFIDWFLFARQPKDIAAYRAQLAPLDPVGFVAQLAPATVFFQFASHDEYVSAAAAGEFYAAALPRKQAATYNAGHDLDTAEVTADRVAWLRRELGIQTGAAR